MTLLGNSDARHLDPAEHIAGGGQIKWYDAVLRQDDDFVHGQ